MTDFLATPKAEPQWLREFGRGHAVPQLLDELVQGGELADMSWHNDICPSFAITARTADADAPRLWVEHREPERRERPGCRYVVDGRDEEPAYAGDDLFDALSALRIVSAQEPAAQQMPVVNERTRADVESLKAAWKEDPCWDLEHTEGFEAHYWELKAFSLQHRLGCMEETVRLAEGLGLTLAGYARLRRLESIVDRLEGR